MTFEEGINCGAMKALSPPRLVNFLRPETCVIFVIYGVLTARESGAKAPRWTPREEKRNINMRCEFRARIKISLPFPLSSSNLVTNSHFLRPRRVHLSNKHALKIPFSLFIACEVTIFGACWAQSGVEPFWKSKSLINELRPKPNSLPSPSLFRLPTGTRSIHLCLFDTRHDFGPLNAGSFSPMILSRKAKDDGVTLGLSVNGTPSSVKSFSTSEENHNYAC